MRFLVGGVVAFLIWATASAFLYSKWYAQDSPESISGQPAESALAPALSPPKSGRKKLPPGYLAAFENGSPLFTSSQTITGKPDSANITVPGEAMSLVRGLADYASANEKVVLVITRRTEEESGPSRGEDIAMTRADTIRRLLVSFGMQPEHISIVSQIDNRAFESAGSLIEFVVIEKDKQLQYLGLNPAQPKVDTDTLTGSVSEEKAGPASWSLTRQIKFAYGTASPIPDPEVDEYLAELAHFLNQEPSRHVEIIGHTCNISSASFNKRLALERAGSVLDLLIEAGVSASRMRASSAGEEQPIADNRTEAGQQANRRVEILIR